MLVFEHRHRMDAVDLASELVRHFVDAALFDHRCEIQNGILSDTRAILKQPLQLSQGRVPWVHVKLMEQVDGGGYHFLTVGHVNILKSGESGSSNAPMGYSVWDRTSCQSSVPGNSIKSRNFGRLSSV